MITCICLIWIGMQLSAPVWYYTLLGVAMLLSIINFGIKMYKAGSKNKE